LFFPFFAVVIFDKTGVISKEITEIALGVLNLKTAVD